MKVALAIPTYNAGNEFRTVLTLINQQRNLVDAIKIIDSTSVDTCDTVDSAKVDTVNSVDSTSFSMVCPD